jgi:hypothetical protein
MACFLVLMGTSRYVVSVYSSGVSSPLDPFLADVEGSSSSCCCGYLSAAWLGCGGSRVVLPPLVVTALTFSKEFLSFLKVLHCLA